RHRIHTESPPGALFGGDHDHIRCPRAIRQLSNAVAQTSLSAGSGQLLMELTIWCSTRCIRPISLSHRAVAPFSVVRGTEVCCRTVPTGTTSGLTKIAQDPVSTRAEQEMFPITTRT
ncbi:hypothetical protein XENOCAPTIV_016808, partial [Xenoophorus captivus]